MNARSRPALLALATLAAAAAPLSCASTQRVSLHCVPRDVVVYVDGRQLETTPEALELATGEPHTLFFKGGGHDPQLVVLESETRDGERRLTPDPCERLAFRAVRPEVRMTVEEAPGAPAR